MLDWLFAPQCIACKALATTPLCVACSTSLEPLGPACPRCAEPTGERAILCRRCMIAPLPLERVIAPWQFGGPLATAIRALKFAKRTSVARAVAPLWAPVLAAAVAEYAAVVVPVPLHWRRRWTRGYDHAWLLARHACAAVRIAAPRPVLRRLRGSPPQSTLPARDRRDNLRGVFAVRDAGAVAGRAVILVDDVVTTGATLAACAHALLAAGATTVVGCALARATSARG